jgi:hypothetical protein
MECFQPNGKIFLSFPSFSNSVSTAVSSRLVSADNHFPRFRIARISIRRSSIVYLAPCFGASGSNVLSLRHNVLLLNPVRAAVFLALNRGRRQQLRP